MTDTENDSRAKKAPGSRNAGEERICPPGGPVIPEQLRRHKKAPGDRAIDVLDRHTPDIDL